MTAMIENPHKEASSVTGCLAAETGAPVQLGREICGFGSDAGEHEWLVTNGIGGFASGTVSGLVTRRYGGLLIAALKPPLGHTLLVAMLEETARYADERYWTTLPISSPRTDEQMELWPLRVTGILIVFGSMEQLRFGHSPVQMRFSRKTFVCKATKLLWIENTSLSERATSSPGRSMQRAD